MKAAPLELARQNPHGIGPTSFAFWTTDSLARPMSSDRLVRGLYEALLHLVLGDEEMAIPARVNEARVYWRGRHIIFCLWRHFYAANMAGRIEKRKVMLATSCASGAARQRTGRHWQRCPSRSRHPARRPESGSPRLQGGERRPTQSTVAPLRSRACLSPRSVASILVRMFNRLLSAHAERRR